LPVRGDQRHDASPAALRALSHTARLKASTPLPGIHHVDSLLFDRWSYTTIRGALPGRPPVAEWLHGRAEWEPPRTTVAWRREVAWLTKEHLGADALEDFLDDYPLRNRETLSDVTSRVLRHLQGIAERDVSGVQFAWLLRDDRSAEIMKVGDLVGQYEPKRNPTLDGATVVLAPQAGGLSAGLLDGAAEFEPSLRYDLGPKDADRLVHESEGRPETPAGMRLVRSVKRMADGDDVLMWWHLYAASNRADDDGSRNSRNELLLDDHLRRCEAWADRIAERIALPEGQRRSLSLAGRAHDLGKRRRLWQRSIKRFTEPALAKGPMQPSELGHYRHELGSLHDGDFTGLNDSEAELALHVVAAHHGRGRPHFPVVESFDPQVQEARVAAIVREVPLRFDRLQRRYGRWGLAWLESLLRAADVLASGADEVAE
jgi:CRISPR-associated endonuclease/helicase Cas3